jgi:hypothetical protein
MTEEEWSQCIDPRLLLIHLEPSSSDRKARLFTCAVGRLLGPFLGDDRSRRVIDVAEHFADGMATQLQLGDAWQASLNVQPGPAARAASCAGDHGPWQGGRMIILALQQAQTDGQARDWSRNLARKPLQLVHEIFGNPFRPVTFDPRWRTSDALGLARSIYEDRAFDRMPVLADALMDAGCADEQVLGHCRGGGPHVRGCWVVDLVLGKE